MKQIAVINPKPIKNSIVMDLEVSFVPMKCVEALSNNIDLSYVRKFKEVKKGFTYFENGDILFAKITPCMENGKIAIAKNLKNGIGFGSTEFHVIRLLDQEMPKKFYFYYMIQDVFRKNAASKMKGTAGQLRVSKEVILNTLIPFPPISEQKRIVAKIESIFAQIDAAEELLNSVQLKIKSYKKSILKYAFEDKIVSKNSFNNHRSDSKYFKEKSDDVQYQIIDYELPEGWMIKKIGDVCEPSQYGWTSSASQIGDLKMLRTTDITKGKINWDRVPYCKTNPSNVEKYILHSNDILISRAGSIGQSYLVINPPKAVFASYLIRFIPKINSKYFKYYLETNFYWNEISRTKIGIAVPNVNATKLKNILIPIPSPQKQEQIVAKIESIFRKIDAMEAHVETTLNTLELLKKSVLKRAFEGKLVPHDPNDEPAEALLKKIKAKKRKN